MFGRFNIVYFILFTNDELCKKGLRDSDNCFVWNLYEDLYHLFFNCCFVQNFWNIFSLVV